MKPTEEQNDPKLEVEGETPTPPIFLVARQREKDARFEWSEWYLHLVFDSLDELANRTDPPDFEADNVMAIDASGRKVAIELAGGETGNFPRRAVVDPTPRHADTLAHILIDAIDTDEGSDLARRDAALPDLVAEASALRTYRRNPPPKLDGCLVAFLVVAAITVTLIVIGVIAVVDFIR